MWRQGDLSWLLWQQQKPIYNGIQNLQNNVDLVVVLCARQFGKSHLGVLMAVEDCLKYPGVCIMIVGPTLDQTRSIVAPRFNKIAQTAPRGLIKQLKSEKKWQVGESELVIGGFDINSSSQRGKTVQNIYIEEVVGSNPDNYTESMNSDLGPALTHSKDGKMIFLTTLPKIPDHPFIIDTMVQAEMSGSLYVYTIDDNAELSDSQYDACVRRAGGKHTIDFRREYLCEIVRDPSLVVVPDYEEPEDLYCRDLQKHLNHQVSIDWGGVRDKTAVVFHTYSFDDDIEYIYDELIYPNNTASDIVMKQMLEKIQHYDHYANKWRIVADMPGQLQVDINVNYPDISIVAPNKQDWLANVNNMAVAFSNHKVKVHERCGFLRHSLRSGTFNKKKTDFERTEALGHCDALAALMYGLRTRDKTNPFSKYQCPETAIRQGTFVLPKPNEHENIVAAIQPKNFVQKFGAKRRF